MTDNILDRGCVGHRPGSQIRIFQRYAALDPSHLALAATARLRSHSVPLLGYGSSNSENKIYHPERMGQSDRKIRCPIK